MRLTTFLLLFFAVTILYSQDTIRVMHYNLLYYGNSAFCSETTNNTDQKDAYFRSILSYARPDIVTVNEMSYQSTYQQRMLSEVMNQAGYALFDMVPGSNIANESIVNVLYYNTEKIAFHSHETAQVELRDIDVFRLYSTEEGLVNGDTIFLNCVVAHLKSGTDGEIMRSIMTENTLNYLEANSPYGNYLFLGDFNFYDADEPGFKQMTENVHPIFRFFDPVDAIGDWHNNTAYQDVHTQSTRTAQAGNCGASGGMDDRFDFILLNQTLYDQSDRIAYLEDSYWALGQDGERLNGTIADPPNTSVPAFLVDALLGMSDHLPVIMDLIIAEDLGTSEFKYPLSDIRYQNPVRDELRLYLDGSYSGNPVFTYSLITASGSTILSEQINASGNSSVSIDVSDVPAGFYILHIQSESGYFSGKVIIAK